MGGTPVPLVNLAPQEEPILGEMRAAIEGILRSRAYVGGGPDGPVARFEAALAKAVGTRHAVALNSGTDAISLALLACGIRPGDEVIVPAFTYNATAAAVARLGAVPVFADVHAESLNLDPGSAEVAATPKTRAMVPVHLYGLPADLPALLSVAKARGGLAVVEDAAQAIASERGGKRAGAMGSRAGAFSFYPTKNLGACGDGGAVTTDEPEVDRIVRTYRNQGEPPGGKRYVHERVGWNSRLDSIQAALLLVKLPRLEAWTEARRERAARYRKLLSDAGLAGDVRVPPDGPGRHVYHLFVVRVPHRDDLQRHLEAKGIGCGVYYPVPLHLQPCFRELGYRPGRCPQAERAAAEVIALPCWPGLPDADQERVVGALREFFRGR